MVAKLASLWRGVTKALPILILIIVKGNVLDVKI